MGRKTETKEIGGIEFRTVQFKATDAMKLMSRIGRVIQDGGGDPSDPMAMLAGADPEKADELFLQILRSTRATVDDKFEDLGTAGGFNEVFTGRLSLMNEVVGWVFEVNFEESLGEGQDAGPPEQVKKPARKSTSRKS